MKKFILILTFIFIMPAWALCPIEEEGVCKISDLNQSMPLFQSQDSAGININKNMPSNSLPATNTGSSFNRTQNQSGIKMQGSLGCQFGNCNESGNNDFLPNQ